MHSCHTCGDPFSDRVVCPSRLHGLQIEPFRLRQVLSLIWPLLRRLGSFDKAAVVAKWGREGLECRSACLQCMALATVGAWPGCLIGTAVSVPGHWHQDRDDLLTRLHPPPQQQVAILPLSQLVVIGCFSKISFIITQKFCCHSFNFKSHSLVALVQPRKNFKSQLIPFRTRIWTLATLSWKIVRWSNGRKSWGLMTPDWPCSKVLGASG